MRTAASVATLLQLKDMTPELAAQVRAIWKTAKRVDIVSAIADSLHHGFLDSTDFGRMLWINRAAQYHGVEFLGQNKHGQDVDFLNAGDCYTATLFFVGGRMFVSTVGDLVERGYIKKEKSF